MKINVHQAICLMFFMVALTTYAQWTTQSITMQPGWNAIFIHVQPETSDPKTLFGDLPIEEVWAWNRRFTTIQYITDPDNLVPEQEDWLVYYPETHESSTLSNLFAVLGARAYLVKISGPNPVLLEIKGKPLVRDIDWLSESYNLVGFGVNPENPPMFQDYFSPFSAHTNLSVFQLQSSGDWTEITEPSSETIKRDQAYWVYSGEPSAYTGPLSVHLEQGDGLHFGRVLNEQQIRIQNHSGLAKTVTIRQSPSENPPDHSETALAGDVPLSFFRSTITDDGLKAEWVPLTEMVEFPIQPQGQLVLRLAVRRPDMEVFALADGFTDALYQSILKISDNHGTDFDVPVSARGLNPLGRSNQGGQGQPSAEATHFRAGLWIGDAVINKVSAPTESDPQTPKPTGSELRYRLLVHVDCSGQTKLLQQTTLLFKEGTLKPDDADSNQMVVDEPGRYVLLTNDSPEMLSKYAGAALRDGEPVGRRVSSVAFSFREPIGMTGAFDDALSTTISVGYDDPLNPFKHKYHPDHDNKNEQFSDVDSLGNAIKESFDFDREVSLNFTQDDPQGLGLAGWGDDQVGGVYRERIEGVHQDDIYMEGFFRLHHAAQVPTLNDEECSHEP